MLRSLKLLAWILFSLQVTFEAVPETHPLFVSKWNREVSSLGLGPRHTVVPSSSPEPKYSLDRRTLPHTTATVDKKVKIDQLLKWNHDEERKTAFGAGVVGGKLAVLVQKSEYDLVRLHYVLDSPTKIMTCGGLRPDIGPSHVTRGMTTVGCIEQARNGSFAFTIYTMRKWEKESDSQAPMFIQQANVWLDVLPKQWIKSAKTENDQIVLKPLLFRMDETGTLSLAVVTSGEKVSREYSSLALAFVHSKFDGWIRFKDTDRERQGLLSFENGVAYVGILQGTANQIVVKALDSNGWMLCSDFKVYRRAYSVYNCKQVSDESVDTKTIIYQVNRLSTDGNQLQMMVRQLDWLSLQTKKLTSKPKGGFLSIDIKEPGLMEFPHTTVWSLVDQAPQSIVKISGEKLVNLIYSFSNEMKYQVAKEYKAPYYHGDLTFFNKSGEKSVPLEDEYELIPLPLVSSHPPKPRELTISPRQELDLGLSWNFKSLEYFGPHWSSNHLSFQNTVLRKATFFNVTSSGRSLFPSFLPHFFLHPHLLVLVPSETASLSTVWLYSCSNQENTLSVELDCRDGQQLNNLKVDYPLELECPQLKRHAVFYDQKDLLVIDLKTREYKRLETLMNINSVDCTELEETLLIDDGYSLISQTKTQEAVTPYRRKRTEEDLDEEPLFFKTYSMINGTLTRFSILEGSSTVSIDSVDLYHRQLIPKQNITLYGLDTSKEWISGICATRHMLTIVTAHSIRLLDTFTNMTRTIGPFESLSLSHCLSKGRLLYKTSEGLFLHDLAVPGAGFKLTSGKEGKAEGFLAEYGTLLTHREEEGPVSYSWLSFEPHMVVKASASIPPTNSSDIDLTIHSPCYDLRGELTSFPFSIIFKVKPITGQATSQTRASDPYIGSKPSAPPANRLGMFPVPSAEQTFSGMCRSGTDSTFFLIKYPGKLTRKDICKCIQGGCEDIDLMFYNLEVNADRVSAFYLSEFEYMIAALDKQLSIVRFFLFSVSKEGGLFERRFGGELKKLRLVKDVANGHFIEPRDQQKTPLFAYRKKLEQRSVRFILRLGRSKDAMPGILSHYEDRSKPPVPESDLEIPSILLDRLPYCGPWEEDCSEIPVPLA